ncbi:MAG: serine/threonine-protein phosphatase [Acidobacteria bacterium]|nr:serine/threonine-protein phosphatase [Acidobacteriota bacterium]
MSTNFISRITKENPPLQGHEMYGNSKGADMVANLDSENLISVAAISDVGLYRSRNEDAFSIADLTTGMEAAEADATPHRIGERGTLLVVADGMGGAAAGQFASRMAVNVLRKSLLKDVPNLPACSRLANATELANRWVYEYAKSHAEYDGMGTTLTAVLVQNNQACLSQVGDSRAYLIRGQTIHQLTKDQTLMQKLLDEGRLSPEATATFPGHIILQAIGTAPTVDYALATFDIYHNDYLLLCSDGLTNKVSAEELRQAVEQSTTLYDACDFLVALANQRGGEDNITVVLAKLYEAKLSAKDQYDFSFADNRKAA